MTIRAMVGAAAPGFDCDWIVIRDLGLVQGVGSRPMIRPPPVSGIRAGGPLGVRSGPT